MQRRRLALAILGLLVLPACRRGEDFATDALRLDCCTTGFDKPECRAAFAKLPPAGIEACAAARELDPSRPHPPHERLCGVTSPVQHRKAAALQLGHNLTQTVRGDPHCHEAGRLAAIEVAIAHPPQVCGEDGCLALLGPPRQARREHVAGLARALGGPSLLRAIDAARDLAPEDRVALLEPIWPREANGLVAAMGFPQIGIPHIWHVLIGDPAPLRLMRSKHVGARLLLAARREEEVILPDELPSVVDAAGVTCPVLVGVRHRLKLDGQRFPKLARCEVEVGATPSAPATATTQANQPAAPRPPPPAQPRPPGSPGASKYPANFYIEQPRLKLPPPKDDFDGMPPGTMAYPAYREAVEKHRNQPRTPVLANSECTGRITACVDPNKLGHNMDACVISVDECKTDKPWMERHCCPKECVAAYVAKRKALVGPITAFRQAFYDDETPCFPGMKEQLRGRKLPGE